MHSPADDSTESIKSAPGLKKFADAVAAVIDPLGMFAPFRHIYMTWLARPQDLNEILWLYFASLAISQRHAGERTLGMPNEPLVSPHPEDPRFTDPIWSESPLWRQVRDSYLLLMHSSQDMLSRTPGLSPQERARALFWWRNWVDAVAPGNFLLTNPVALRKAMETHGESLVRGLKILIDDVQAGTVQLTDPAHFEVGRNLATTPGAVVFRNQLLEVIHYTPTVAEVHRIPLVIVTPWINKFYILDLTPAKSMIHYLLKQGFDVFITSWKNPSSEMRETGFDDYLTQGVDEIVRVARAITGAPRVHAVGYCIGGTLLATYMAWLNRRYENREEIPVASWTLLASLVDFGAPGDIAVFIDENTVRGLATQMATAGYMDGQQMAAAFRLLRPNSLIWQYVVHGYLYGEAPEPNDVLYWNMDTTRMPYRMHEYYLREMYLHNNLVRKDALTIAGQTIDLGRIVQPLYNVSAVDDHITPWRQTFRINNIVTGPKRCALSSSGHILGIVNSPATPSHHLYWAAEAREEDSPELWRERAQQGAGSWWDDWIDWLAPQCGANVAAPAVATTEFPKLADAPGTYVLER